MHTVEQLLDSKGHRIVTLRPEASVLEATELMNEHHIGSVLVMREEDLVGIFTERDLLRRVVAAQRNPARTPLAEVMTSPVACAGPDTTLNEIRDAMRRQRIRHMPVLDAEGRIIGVVSIGDLNRVEHEVHEQTIQYLERYMYCP